MLANFWHAWFSSPKVNLDCPTSKNVSLRVMSFVTKFHAFIIKLNNSVFFWSSVAYVKIQKWYFFVFDCMRSFTTLTMNPLRERLFPPLRNNVEKRQEIQTNSRPPHSRFKGDTFASSSHCTTHAAVNEQKNRAKLLEGDRDLQLYSVTNQRFSRRHGSPISDCSHRREQKFRSGQKRGKVHFYRTKRMLVIFESNELQSSAHDIDCGKRCFL